jgi:hypothetical protein
MKELNFTEVDASLYMADMSESDKSGLWTIVEPDSPYGANESEMFDCAIRHYTDDCKTYPIKHLGSFESLRKAMAYLNFLWENGKTYDALNAVEYVAGHVKYEFELP